MISSRLVSLNALLRIDLTDSYSNIVIDKEIKKADLDKRDASFASNLFYGVIERKIELDYIISKCTKKQINKIDVDILNIIRMGIYQILYMGKVPSSAAVNESVNLAKAVKKFSASGFVNGILRNVVRSKEELKIVPQNYDRLDYLNLKYSIPKRIISIWDKNYGKNCCEELLKSMLHTPPIYARVNTLKISANELIESLKCSGIIAEESVLGDAILIKSFGLLEKVNEFNKGYFHIQDLASQVCCNLINPKPGETILDVCSAPGGKAFTIAEIMKNKGNVFAFDLYDSKVNLVNKGAKRLGLSIISARVRDALSDDNLPQSDKVLCDVPCSGLGIIRRKPEIKYKNLDNIANLPILQYNILCKAEKFVKLGGLLIYSTCTLNHEENGMIVDRFLSEHVDYEPQKINLPLGISRCIDEPLNQLTLMPQFNNTDGFFISLFRKRG